MYLKVNIICKSISKFLRSSFFIIGLATILHGCTPFQSTGGEREQRPRAQSVENLFNVPGQIVVDDLVRSIQFHKTGSTKQPAIIELNSNDRLQLTFELLEFDSRQFRVNFSHHNPDWSRSSLPAETFMDGLFSTYLNAGQPARVQRPQYRQYSYRFPNDDVRFRKSGNYMLTIEDADTGYLVLSIPFFVSENQGRIASSVDERITPRQNMRTSHRPESRYRLPDFVEHPQFDLEFYYVQNQFWGRARKAEEVDFSSPAEVHFELDRNRPFIGDYEFLELRLDELSQRNPQVLEYLPAEIPPKIILFDDVNGFSASGRMSGAGTFGIPDMSLNARYADVVFNFDADIDPEISGEIYLVGDFNNWAIQSGNRMQYDERTARWQTNTVLKEGTYRYKYVLLDEDGVNDLYFDDLFTNTRQEYHTFVYMRDNREFYYRLLQYNHFFSDF